MPDRCSWKIAEILFAILLLALQVPLASASVALEWADFVAWSPGSSDSGPVTVSCKQTEHGISELTITAFGKTIQLPPDAREKLKNTNANGLVISYAASYEPGVRAIYLRLIRELSPSERVEKRLVIAENGGITFLNERIVPSFQEHALVLAEVGITTNYLKATSIVQVYFQQKPDGLVFPLWAQAFNQSYPFHQTINEGLNGVFANGLFLSFKAGGGGEDKRTIYLRLVRESMSGIVSERLLAIRESEKSVLLEGPDKP